MPDATGRGTDKRLRRLVAWLEAADLGMMFLEDGGFALDFSGGSLARVGEMVVARARPFDEMAQGAAGYVGETLLRLAGGHWEWTDGGPNIHADDALDLPPLDPVQLVARAVITRDDSLFSQTYATWELAVTRYRAAHPSWTPTKHYTPVFDPEPPLPDDAETLRAWLADRSRAFTAWADEHSADGPWDFTAESLDRLEALLLRRIPTRDALSDPQYRDFADTAAWYFGEVLLRGRTDGEWVFRKRNPAAPHDLYADKPFLRSRTLNVMAQIPEVVFRLLVGGDGTSLRGRYDQWSR